MITNQTHSNPGNYTSHPAVSSDSHHTEQDPDPFPPQPSDNLTSEEEEPPEQVLQIVKPVLSFPSEKAQSKTKGNFPFMSYRSRIFRDQNFPGVSDADWNNWKWQFKNRIRTLEGLEKLFDLSDAERDSLILTQGNLPLAVTPYYASLLDSSDSLQPLRRTVIPTLQEFTVNQGESDDPLDEEGHCVAPGLFHRYPDRVLFLATNLCSVNCRYCTRSRVVGDDEAGISKKDWDSAIQYIAAHPEVRDVLVSGGDPLTLPEESLEYLLKRLRDIPHVEVIRLGTKVPMVLPQRITDSLLRILKKYHPLWMSIHCTHPEEITLESSEACRRLADAGIPLGSQTVLLKGVNNSVDTLKTLFQKLMRIRVKPYYLYQCDPIAGSAHFRTTVREGINIIRGIRGFTSGYAVPHYVIDAPGGGGKIPISPDYIQGTRDGSLVLKNYEGKTYVYPDDSLLSER